MTRFLAAFLAAAMLGGCVVVPADYGYGYRDYGYRDGNHRHDGHRHKGHDHRRDWRSSSGGH